MFINKTHLSPVYKPVIRERHAYCHLIYSYDQRPRGQSTDLCKFPTQCINTQKHTPYKSDTTTTHSPGLQLVGDTIT